MLETKIDVETETPENLEAAEELFDKIADGKCQNCGFDFFCECTYIG